MIRWFYLVVVAAAVGCSPPSPQPKKEPSGTPPAAKETKTAAKTVEEAKTELQSRIDCCLGGQAPDSLFNGTITIWAVGKTIQSIDIVRVVQKYDEGGKPVPNYFVGALKATAADSIAVIGAVGAFATALVALLAGKG